MTKRDEDREIARLFEELRRAEEVSVPGFREVLERRHPRKVTPAARLLMRFAGVAALAIVLAVAVLLVRRPEALHRTAPGPALAEWKAPTDSLLRTPGIELLESLPSLPAVPEPVRLPPDQKGVSR